jgi:hypothetical protein
MDVLHSPFGLVPVLAEFDFATHDPLVAAQAGLVSFETIERGNVATIAQGGAADNAPVDAYSAGGAGNRLLDFALSLDAAVAWLKLYFGL